MDSTTPTTETRYGVRFDYPRRFPYYEYYVGILNGVLITTLKPEDVSTWPTVDAAYNVAKAIRHSLWPEGCESICVFIVEEPAYDA
jgi:hypothetical protein